MNKTTTAELIEALRTMTPDERIAALRAARPDLYKAPVISFGKAPADGWKDSDRVPAK